MADVEKQLNATVERITELREKATKAALDAFNEDPTNSYVLETFARDLIHTAQIDDTRRVENACIALGHLFQACGLESADVRQERLRDLVDQAIALISTHEAEAEIEDMCRKGNPFGFMARMCCIVGAATSDRGALALASLPEETLDRALQIADEAPPDVRHWALLKLQYELTVARNPEDFAKQLGIIDELEGAQYRATVQDALERAILLHQVGRHPEGNDAFLQLRKRLWDSDLFVRIPERLRLLKDIASGNARVCEARVVEEPTSYRAKAEVFDLNGVRVPFIAQDWGIPRKPVGERFRCRILFGPKGPMAKPPV